MKQPVSALELLPIAVEGAVDRFCGRPRDRNPYSFDRGNKWSTTWLIGWDDAHHLLEQRGQEEAARWLSEAV